MDFLVVPVPERRRETGRAAAAREKEKGRLRLLIGAGLGVYLFALMAGAVIETPELAREGGSFLVHAGAFAVSQLFVFLLAPRWRARVVWLLLLFLFGILIEAAQYFLPWRSGTAIDLLYNAIGLALGFTGCALLERFARWRGWLPLSPARRCS